MPEGLLIVRKLGFEKRFIHLKYITPVLLNPDISCFANSVDPDQLASEEAN